MLSQDNMNDCRPFSRKKINLQKLVSYLHWNGKSPTREHVEYFVFFQRRYIAAFPVWSLIWAVVLSTVVEVHFLYSCVLHTYFLILLCKLCCVPSNLTLIQANTFEHWSTVTQALQGLITNVILGLSFEYRESFATTKSASVCLLSLGQTLFRQHRKSSGSRQILVMWGSVSVRWRHCASRWVLWVSFSYIISLRVLFHLVCSVFKMSKLKFLAHLQTSEPMRSELKTQGLF